VGSPSTPEFTRLHHPARWHFDVLRGLDALADAGVSHDSRMDAGLELLVGLRVLKAYAERRQGVDRLFA
jgi:hypothetical protein